MTDVIMGVGDGRGNLFVRGDFESIQAAQTKLLELERLRRCTEDALRVLGSYNPSQPSGLRKQKIDDAIAFLKLGRDA